MGLLGALLAIAVALITWPLTLTLLKSGAGPIGGADALSMLLFLAPVVFLVIRALDSNSGLAAMWAVALAPVFGALNIILAILVLGASGQKNPAAEVLVQIILSSLWVLPIFLMAKRKRSDEQAVTNVRCACGMNTTSVKPTCIWCGKVLPNNENPHEGNA